MNSAEIESLASRSREMLGIPDDERPDPIDLLRRAKFAKVIGDWRFVPDDQLPRAEANWDDASREILIRDSLRARIENGEADAAFTVFHELGHVLLGHGQRNRAPDGNRQFGRFIENDENEADLLASALMAPAHLSGVDDLTTVEALARRFRLPLNKAQARLLELQRQRRHLLGLARPTPMSLKRIDTGDYNEAMPEMMRNAMRWNS